MTTINPIQFIWEHLTTQIPIPDVDLTGRVCLVTGGNQGLGLATAIHFARLNAARIIISSRDQKRGEAASEQVFQTVTSFRGTVDVWPLDLSSFASVKEFVERAKRESPRLDIVVLNAGVTGFDWEVTKDGWEETLQVNVLSTGLLGMLLLPKMLETGNLPNPTPAAGKKALELPHLTVLSSGMHYFAKWKCQDAPEPMLVALNDKKYHDPADTYSISKLLDVFFAREVAQLPSISGKIVVNSIDPGLCKTSLRRRFPSFIEWFINCLAWSTEFGSRSILVGAVTMTTPGAFICNGHERLVSYLAASPKGFDLQKKFWNEVTELWKGVAPEISQVLGGSA